MLNIVRVPFSASAEEGAWGASAWFEDDFCRGPGNVFYVHPDGRVAVCCGFANENPQLVIGNIRKDDYRSLMRRASQNAFVRACYEAGLGATRERLEAAERRFPGKTGDPCFFCDYCAKNSIIKTQ
jgi:radical SAM protein with 4Fe4S-binding SPASM domain